MRATFLSHPTEHKSTSQKLRSDPSEGEKKVWNLVRGRRMHGLKFRRQHPIGRYFADFAWPEIKLVIEVDGHIHALQQERDELRTREIEAMGWTVVRVSAVEAVTNPDGVWDWLDRLLRGRLTTD